MKRIGIIGAGFSGTMTAVQLIRKTTVPIELVIINPKESFNRGIAYNANSDQLILNVIASKMSAFPDNPDHFLDWVQQQNSYKDYCRNLLALTFLPRNLYGRYLESIWQESLDLARSKGLHVRIIHGNVIDLNTRDQQTELVIQGAPNVSVDCCVLATGNNLPGNPPIRNAMIYGHSHYFKNPWDKEAIMNPDSSKPIMIVGNGLTMVDAVIGLIEHGFKNDIITISKHGYNILPHRYLDFKYPDISPESIREKQLIDIVSILMDHLKKLSKLGHTIEPVIDAIRPYTQSIWRQFSINDKKVFLSQYLHLWNRVRHRVPPHINDRLNALKDKGLLKVKSGKIIDITEQNGILTVVYKEFKGESLNLIEVSRIINCTGSANGIRQSGNILLQNCLKKGIICEDETGLGILTDDSTYQVISPAGKIDSNFFAIGPLLKGILWETTAVNEIRNQSDRISSQIL